ncbi:hypothetical protein QFC19_005339 [Naganishia cerealis]|uniref:Uncharacterized protein n=1 Tax=Naganishia cerealis TaxID=610337 RepID=A0ACC2VNH2_9TREE|nr:hypothetical protein QFC19_005339 [Naganishia cerealis]
MNSDQWQPIGRTSNQIILYHPPSNALSVRRYREDPVTIASLPGTPASASRVTSHVNLPVLVPRTQRNGSQGDVVISHRNRGPMASRNSPTESASAIPPSELCPYCYRPMPKNAHQLESPEEFDSDRQSVFAPTLDVTSTAHVLPIFSDDSEAGDYSSRYHDRQEWSPQQQNQASEVHSGLLHVRPYFQILEQSVDGSRTSTPVPEVTPERSAHEHSGNDSAQPTRSVEGYYHRFFIEEKRLGMGAEGSVYLCQHVLDGNYLGHYAIKKIAVGNSKPYLIKMLQEVRLLEQLRHPNIIPYHHVWIEDTQFSSFTSPIATLHVLMSYANAGNLDDFVKSRCSTAGDNLSIHPVQQDEEISPEEMKRRIRERRKSARSISEAGNKAEFNNNLAKEQARRKRGDARAVMLLGTEEIASLFGDVVNGLHYLHSNGILHLDLKCSNVLLHNRDGELIPRAMISDFGTSEEMLHRNRERTGHTGTMEYMAPETISPDSSGHWRELDTKADIWSLDIKTAFKKRGLPLGLLTLLEELTNVVPSKRPSIQKVVQKSTALYTQASSAQSASANDEGALVPRTQFLPSLRNPWGASKEDKGFGSSKVQAVATDNSIPASLEGAISSIGAIPQAKHLYGALGLFKLCTLLPPMRSEVPPASILYILIVMIVVDLQAENLVLSYVLSACHAMALWWLRGK